MNIVIPALAFLLVSALVMGSNIQGPEEAQVRALKLEKPQFEWVRCNCPNGTELGLTENDFIVFQMYLQGLEHQAGACQDELIWPPSTRFVEK